MDGSGNIGKGLNEWYIGLLGLQIERNSGTRWSCIFAIYACAP